MGNILVTRSLPEPAMKLLRAGHEVGAGPADEAMPAEEIARRLVDCDALACWLNDAIPADLIDAAPNLKVIANYGVGYDNIDAAHAKARGIVVCNTPDVLSDATADIAFGMLLMLARWLLPADRFVREGRFQGWDASLFLGRDLKHKTLGIFGMGSIGRAMARRARGANMEVIYHNRTRLDPALEQTPGARYVPFEELIETSDYISLHCPLNDDSRHRFTHKEFARMKDGGFLINTARGPVVKEDDLVEALQSGQLAGAGLDVYEFEPQVTAELLTMDNVVLLPHIGSATIETRREMAELVARNILNVLAGKPAETPV